MHNVKYILSPAFVEVWLYDQMVGWSPRKKRSSPSKCRTITPYETLKNQQRYYERQRNIIKRIINCNNSEDTSFLTLTYRNNEQDLSHCNYDFKKFCQKLKRHLKKKNRELKYLAIWERQKRGAIHYHVILFDMPYIPRRELEAMWEHGYMKVNQIKTDVQDVGNYISKYFTKDIKTQEKGKKRFFYSRNLKKPKEIRLTADDVTAFIPPNPIHHKEIQQYIPINGEMIERKVDYFVCKAESFHDTGGDA